MNSYYTYTNLYRNPPLSPWMKTAIERSFRSKENTKLDSPKLATSQYSTGNSPRKLEALNRQDGSYIFDAESCNI